MKKINGQFIGKVKVSLDSKYMNGKGLDEDIRKTSNNLEEMRKELDLVLEKYKKRFRNFETAEDEYIEVLRDEVLKILNKRGL